MNYIHLLLSHKSYIVWDSQVLVLIIVAISKNQSNYDTNLKDYASREKAPVKIRINIEE